MPWKECKPMDERLRFVARLLEGEKMTTVCREFGISRVTGYKIFKRYKERGLDGDPTARPTGWRSRSSAASSVWCPRNRVELHNLKWQRDESCPLNWELPF